jgi:hypothetical protein
MHQSCALNLPLRTSDGRFVLLRALGGGAAAQVFEAHDMTREERVALKVLQTRAWDNAVSAPGSLDAVAAEWRTYERLGAADGGSGGADPASAHGVPRAFNHGVLHMRGFSLLHCCLIYSKNKLTHDHSCIHLMQAPSRLMKAARAVPAPSPS